MYRTEFRTIQSDINVAVLGEEGVGKSALMVRLITNRFITEYASGIDEVFNESYYMEYNEKHYTVNYADCITNDANGKRQW